MLAALNFPVPAVRRRSLLKRGYLESIMSKKSSTEKINRRRKMAKAAAPKRMKLKAIARDKSLSMEDRFAAVLKLPKCRATRPDRIRNRCEVTGRPRVITASSG